MEISRWTGVLALIGLFATQGIAQEPATQRVRIKDIATVGGVRDNPLLGYGMVVGLNGTGDRRQTVFSTQTLVNVLQRMGIQVPPESIRVNNVASVFVTATLPPAARPGMRIDVTVSSIGDAKSLEGGLLLLTPLSGADGQTYAAAQGPVTLGGYSVGQAGSLRQVNHPTVARIPSGGIVEQMLPADLAVPSNLSLSLRDHDFSTALGIANAINLEFGFELSRALDGRTIEVALEDPSQPLPALLARIENLEVSVYRPAKVIVNERTGTVVMGTDVRLGAVSVLHGGLTIEVSTHFEVSQPNAFGEGDTVVVPQTEIRAGEALAQRVELPVGATVETLVQGLQTIGATARDIVAILQAIKAAGALQAELEVI